MKKLNNETGRNAWNKLNTDIVKITDENNCNIANAEMRYAKLGIWLYVDDVDGFSLLKHTEAEKLVWRC